jgi:hypothetical protein
LWLIEHFQNRPVCAARDFQVCREIFEKSSIC